MRDGSQAVFCGYSVYLPLAVSGLVWQPRNCLVQGAYSHSANTFINRAVQLEAAKENFILMLFQGNESQFSADAESV